MRKLRVIVCLLAGFVQLDASATCDGSTATKRFPRLAPAIDTWEHTKNIRLTADIRSQVFADYCNSAESLIDEGKYFDAKNRVDLGTERIVDDYLTGLVANPQGAKSMAAAVRAEFGVAGFSRPDPRALGRLVVDYQKTVDYVKIGGERLERAVQYLLPTGKTKFEGFAGFLTVCTLDALIQASSETKIKC
jgi:hypothetical protein